MEILGNVPMGRVYAQLQIPVEKINENPVIYKVLFPEAITDFIYLIEGTNDLDLIAEYSLKYKKATVIPKDIKELYISSTPRGLALSNDKIYIALDGDEHSYPFINTQFYSFLNYGLWLGLLTKYKIREIPISYDKKDCKKYFNFDYWVWDHNFCGTGEKPYYVITVIDTTIHKDDFIYK